VAERAANSVKEALWLLSHEFCSFVRPRRFQMVEPSIQSLRDRASQLDEQKKVIEGRLQEIIYQLDSMPGKPGLREPLVDEEVLQGSVTYQIEVPALLYDSGQRISLPFVV
jgi:hypothetical protein